MTSHDDVGAGREREQIWGGSASPRVAIVGAGFGGIGLGALLARKGIDSFTIYDRADNVGGTWWHNRYPGAEVDTTSYVYSYAFKPHAWTRTHARRDELLQYLEDTVEEFGLRTHLRLGVSVESATWDEETHSYVLELGAGERAECDVLVAATGFLNIPKYPSLPGLEQFAGPAFHTARWESEHDLADKTIAVVGTGSSATQAVPELAKVAKKLYLFQRQPGWIIPKDERDFSPRGECSLPQSRALPLGASKVVLGNREANLERCTFSTQHPSKRDGAAGRLGLHRKRVLRPPRHP
jgi:cation diffusion facilitator CzcD-associated flavoprotein CzcO